MSLPTTLYFLDKDYQQIGNTFFNVGWVLTAGALVHALRRDVTKVPEGTEYVSVYSYIIPRQLLRDYFDDISTLTNCIDEIIQKENRAWRERNGIPERKDPEKPAENKKLESGEAVLIPMIRKTLPTLLAEDIVGVQPMKGDELTELFDVKYVEYKEPTNPY